MEHTLLTLLDNLCLIAIKERVLAALYRPVEIRPTLS